jgi:copper chaperone CopZ
MPQLRLKVEGIDCADEVVLVRRAIEPIPGVTAIEASALQPIVVVQSDSAIDASVVIAALERAGLRAHVATPERDDPAVEEHRRSRRTC